MKDWVSQAVKVAEFAMSQTQACHAYAVFTFGLRHEWTYLLRTLPDMEDLLEPLECAIADVLIPSITDHHCTTPNERDLLAMPVRLGELGIINPSQDADLQYQASMKTTAPLVEKIVSQVHETPDDATAECAKIEKQSASNNTEWHQELSYSEDTARC